MSADFTPGLSPYKETGTFRFWCQKVLPLVYDDSLSYYELLCKVVNYLNDVISNVDGIRTDTEALRNAYIELQDYVNSYFDNLDVQQEINIKLDEMATNGDLTVLIAPLVPDAVSEWLQEYLTPTSPPVDHTLQISGAAADAKTVGDKFISDREKALNVLNKQVKFIQRANALSSEYYKTFTALNPDKCYLLKLTVTTAGTYSLRIGTDTSSAAMVDTLETVTLGDNESYDYYGYVPSTSGLDTSRLSQAIPYTLDIYEVVDLTSADINDAIYNKYMYQGTDANDIDENSIYYVDSTVAHLPASGSAFLIETWLYNESGTARTQNAFAWSGDNKGKRYFRNLVSGNWTVWKTYDDIHPDIIRNNYAYAGTDLNDINENSICYAASTVLNVPNTDSAFFVETWLYNTTGTARAQIAYAWSGDNKGKRYFRTLVSRNWTVWRTFDNPVDHGWIETTNDTTDRTDAIMSKLANGYCHLGEGTFYVRGQIDMPENATLEGCGKNTVIRLLDSVTDGYCVKVGRGNTVKGIYFLGASDNTAPSTPTIGGRNAINYISNSDGEESAQPTVLTSIITQCFFKKFNGSGIYVHNTGGSMNESLIVSDCYFERCEAGINLDYYVEYCKISNIITFRCYYACINNGGNNVFTGCTFHGTIGLLMDNSSGTKRNNGHGSAIGCTFNHIDNWNHPETLGGGLAVKALSIENGFIFSGCQIFYGGISMEGCKGFSFSNCLFGGNSAYSSLIVGTGSYPAFLMGCIFHGSLPTISLPNDSKVLNCYYDETGAAITA